MTSTSYDSWVFLQLEPDAILRGNGKRYQPIKPTAEQVLKSNPDWRKLEKEFQEMKKRQKENL